MHLFFSRRYDRCVTLTLKVRFWRAPAANFLQNSLPFARLKPLPNVAWHYSKEVIARAKDKKHSLRIISSSLDYRIQQTVIQKATQFSKQLSTDQNIAVMVTNGNTGEILAYLGSLGLNSNAGFMNLTRAVRSPGSTLKPFIYGMAFDDNFYAEILRKKSENMS